MIFNPRSFSLLIVCLTLAVGCSNAPEPELPDRVKNLENLAANSIPANTDTVILTRDQTYSFSGDSLAGTISLFSVDPEGRVFIADDNKQTIHVFSPEGEYITHFGREGKGPGEFVDRSGLLHFHSNKVYAWDSQLQRINIFSLDSLAYVDQVKVQPASLDNTKELRTSNLPLRLWLEEVRNDSTFLMSSVNFHSEGNSDAEPFERIYAMNRDGEINLDPVFREKLPPDTPYSRGARTLLTVIGKNDHFFSLWNEDILVREYNAEGEYLRAFYYPFENATLSRDSLLNLKDFPGYKKSIRNAPLPDTWPAVDALRIDSQRRLWISTRVPNHDIRRWWVLSSGGELLGQFDWPQDQFVIEIQDGYLYTQEYDEETGLGEVVRYGISMQSI